jgi:hypothetical protein
VDELAFGLSTMRRDDLPNATNLSPQGAKRGHRAEISMAVSDSRRPLCARCPYVVYLSAAYQWHISALARTL